jgi:PAS domain S-box-containing protein
MRLVKSKLREFLYLNVAIVVALLLGAYSLYAFFLEIFFSVDARLSPPAPLLTFLVFWLFGILLLAYRRWRHVAISDHELEEIITGINPDAFIVVNPERQIMMCSPSVEKMFGFGPRELLGKTTDAIYHDRRPASGDEHGIHDQLDRLGFHLGNATGRHKNGAIVPLEIITAIVRGRRGAVLLLRDITRRVEAERATREKEELVMKLQENYAKLHETEEARDNILHMIVHDMKNPLQVILGSMQLLKEEMKTGSPDSIASYVDETLSHTRRLIDMVRSLLDVSRLESGEMPLHPSECDLRVAARRALASLARVSNGRIAQVYAPADPVPVLCDSEIIHRVLTNLISNAFYHTPEDSRVSITVTPGEEFARVAVSDTGPGIPPEFHDRIFKKFARLDSAPATSQHWSTGLGLPFCKLAIEAHGGRIAVESEKGKGTTFWFTLPCHPATVRDESATGSRATKAG